MSSVGNATWRASMYGQLRRVAGNLFRHERSKDLLQPTALLHEAYLRVVRGGAEPESRTRFFAAAVGEMRRVLIDEARRKNAEKRHGHRARLTLDSGMLTLVQPTIDLTEIHDALERLAELSPRQARVVELRFLAGLSEEETAAELGVSRRTVQQDWRGAKAWLRRALSGEEPTSTRPTDSQDDALPATNCP